MNPLRVASALAGAVLLIAIGFVIIGSGRESQATFHRELIALLPDNVEATGWTRTLEPIADTPEMQKAVGELLSYDDGVFAIYTDGARRISVYVAYWMPGKMSHRLVAAHTPDVCWGGGGWKKVDSGTWPEAGSRDETGKLKPEWKQTAGGGRESAKLRPQVSGLRSPLLRVQPGELRTFIMNGQTEHVVFWHLVGGKAKSYGTQYAAPWWAMFTDMWEKGLNQREEQFFVRISSSEPIEAIWDEPIVQHVIARVPGLALSEDR